MSSKRPISRRAWAFFFAGLVVCTASVVGARRWQPMLAGADLELSRLLAERDQLSGASDEVRRPLAEKWAIIRQRAWTAEQLAQLQQELAAHWRWEWGPGERPSRVVLHALARDMKQWPHCVAALRTLSAKPGIIVETLDVRARGSASHRAFTTMTIGVRFVRDEPAPGDAERSAPSRSPLPVAARDDPDTHRKVGSVPPLRSIPARPSGSASGLINQDPKKETTQP